MAHHAHHQQTMIASDTITAQATPPGRGGVAIIRVSGPYVKDIIQQILKCELQPRKACLLPFLDEKNEMIDEGVAIFFPNPHSFTGEDVLELQGHGGPIVVDLLLQRILSLGARIAKPGEFSERAFLNGKIDLTQAESIADLINASSKEAAKLAIKSLQGDFSKTIYQLTESITHLRIFIEASIDFTDEEIDFLSDQRVHDQLNDILNRITQIEINAKQGSLLREGITAVIAGEPNVGKSSLLNALSGKELAIVTEIPGTTRDVLRDYILIDEIPMHIIDTAGIRESDDVVEREGIRRAHQEIEKADLILYVLDITKTVPLSLNLSFTQPVIFIHNKIDLINEVPSIKIENDQTIIALSAKSQVGIELLKKQIKSLVGFQEKTEGMYLARRRHLDALKRTREFVIHAMNQLPANALELIAEDLRMAQLALSEITGEFRADDLLGRIFSSFCIGK